MRKTISIALALILVLSLGFAAIAEDNEEKGLDETPALSEESNEGENKTELPDDIDHPEDESTEGNGLDNEAEEMEPVETDGTDEYEMPDDAFVGLFESYETLDDIEIILIKAFAELDDDVAYQGYDAGEVRSEDELNLPDKLVAYDEEENEITIE